MQEQIRYVVRRGGEYLVALAYKDSKTARWSKHAFDAVRIPWLDEAKHLADYFGAEVVTFSTTKGVIEQ